MTPLINKLIVLIVGIATLLPCAAAAGTITVTSGPTFAPAAAFGNNTIHVVTLHNPPGVTGEIIRISGNATITSPSSNTVTADLAGTYAGNSGDNLGLIFSFTIDSNIPFPVEYRLGISATLRDIPLGESSMTSTVLPGLHQYQKQIPVIPIGSSGTFTEALSFNFGASATAHALSSLPGTMNITIQQIDLQVASGVPTVPPPSQLLNISTRVNVGTGDGVLIGGFIISGAAAKQVILRAIGPSLAFSGVRDVLANPILELHKADGTIVTNDNWKDNSPGDRETIVSTGLAPAADAESIIVTTLDPGNYTAIIRGGADSTGVALFEAYDLDTTVDSQLANISTRGVVQSGDDVMIGGFILGPQGSNASRIIVRALGPSLADHEVTTPLRNPSLEMYNSNGDIIAANDDWMDDPNQDQIAAAGLAPPDEKESALLMNPAPGNYTAIVRGVANSTGVSLVEAYNLQNISR